MKVIDIDPMSASRAMMMDSEFLIVVVLPEVDPEAGIRSSSMHPVTKLLIPLPIALVQVSAPHWPAKVHVDRKTPPQKL